MEGELEVICNRDGARIFANGKIEGTRFKVQVFPTLGSGLPGGFEYVIQAGVRASRRFFTRNLVGVGEYWRSKRPCFFASLGANFFCEGATLSCDISAHPVKSHRRRERRTYVHTSQRAYQSAMVSPILVGRYITSTSADSFFAVRLPRLGAKDLLRGVLVSTKAASGVGNHFPRFLSRLSQAVDKCHLGTNSSELVSFGTRAAGLSTET